MAFDAFLLITDLPKRASFQGGRRRKGGRQENSNSALQAQFVLKVIP